MRNKLLRIRPKIKINVAFVPFVAFVPVKTKLLTKCRTRSRQRDAVLLSQTDGKDAEQADDDAENCHKAVAFAEADGGI